MKTILGTWRELKKWIAIAEVEVTGDLCRNGVLEGLFKPRRSQVPMAVSGGLQDLEPVL